MENVHDQTDIRVRIDTQQLQAIQHHMGRQSYRKITTASLTLLSWALDEIANGRIIVSANQDNGDIRQLVIPELLSAVK